MSGVWLIRGYQETPHKAFVVLMDFVEELHIFEEKSCKRFICDSNKLI